jgi:hypothetical protein
MGAMNLGGDAEHPHQTPNGSSAPSAHSRDDQSGKVRKDKDKDKDKKKKHLHLFR